MYFDQNAKFGYFISCVYVGGHENFTLVPSRWDVSDPYKHALLHKC